MESTISSLIGAAEKGDELQPRIPYSALYIPNFTGSRNENWHGGDLPQVSSVTTLLHEAYLDISAREGNSFSRPGSLYGLCRARDARTDH